MEKAKANQRSIKVTLLLRLLLFYYVNVINYFILFSVFLITNFKGKTAN